MNGADATGSTRRDGGPPIPPAENPFRVRFIAPGALPYQFVDPQVTLATLAEKAIAGTKLRSTPWLIVGEHGSGKSTLLAGLVDCLSATWGEPNLVRFSSADSRRQKKDQLRETLLPLCGGGSPEPGLAPPGFLVIDGLEQLDRLSRLQLRLRITRADVPCLATSHRVPRGWNVLHRTALGATLIRRLCGRLLDGYPPPVQDRIEQVLSSRDLDKVTDLRAFWFELYDVVADMSAPPDPSP